MPGQKWLDNGLDDAVALSSVLKEYQVYDKVDIAAIDITNINGRINKKASDIVLLTKNKVSIEWGRPISTDKLFEAQPADKIRNLYRVLEVSPQLQGIKCVKIQFDQPYIVLLEHKNPSAQSPPSQRPNR